MFAGNKMEGKINLRSIKTLMWWDSPSTAEGLMVSSPP